MPFVYIVRCADGTLYTGSARDVDARIDAHNRARGAKYTRGRAPVRLVYCEPCESAADALRRERAIKRLTRAQKQALIFRSGRISVFATAHQGGVAKTEIRPDRKSTGTRSPTRRA